MQVTDEQLIAAVDSLDQIARLRQELQDKLRLGYVELASTRLSCRGNLLNFSTVPIEFDETFKAVLDENDRVQSVHDDQDEYRTNNEGGTTLRHRKENTGINENVTESDDDLKVLLRRWCGKPAPKCAHDSKQHFENALHAAVEMASLQQKILAMIKAQSESAASEQQVPSLSIDSGKE